MKTQKFPDHWPENCPPSDATDNDRTIVFRITSQKELSDAYFQCYEEMGKKYRGKPSCRGHSLSVLRDFETVCHFANVFPRLGTFVSRGTLPKGSGVHLITSKDGHISWWPSLGTERASLFEEPQACTL